MKDQNKVSRHTTHTAIMTLVGIFFVLPAILLAYPLSTANRTLNNCGDTDYYSNGCTVSAGPYIFAAIISVLYVTIIPTQRRRFKHQDDIQRLLLQQQRQESELNQRMPVQAIPHQGEKPPVYKAKTRISIVLFFGSIAVFSLPFLFGVLMLTVNPLINVASFILSLCFIVAGFIYYAKNK